MKKQTMMIVFLVVLAGVAALIWSRRDMIGVPPEKGSDLAVIIDNSSSQTIDCAEVAALVGSGLNDLTIGKFSHLTLYSLGSSANAYEPVQQLDIQLSKGSGGTRKALRKVEKACSAFGVVDGSSIFRATEAVLDQIQTRGLSGSKLILDSDLGENADRRLFEKHGKKTALLHNAGIKSFICGVAVTNEGGGPRGARADALVRTWRNAFASPKEVTISPFCPGQAAPQMASR